MRSTLPRRVRRLELLSIALGLALGGALLAGLAAPDPVTVRAARFEMVDGDGKVRGYWRITDDGSAAITLYDSDGRARVALYAAPSGASEVVASNGAGAEHKLRIEADGRAALVTKP